MPSQPDDAPEELERLNAALSDLAQAMRASFPTAQEFLDCVYDLSRYMAEKGYTTPYLLFETDPEPDAE